VVLLEGQIYPLSFCFLSLKIIIIKIIIIIIPTVIHSDFINLVSNTTHYKKKISSIH